MNKKALLITLAALAGILAVTAAVTLLTRGRGGTRFDGRADAKYPYSWVEKDNGTVVLTMSAGDAADGAWSLARTEGEVLEIGVKGKRDQTEAVLTPIEAGREAIVFSLMSGEERLAELSFTVEVGRDQKEKLAATITKHDERAMQGVVRGGEETGHPFIVRGDSDGMTICVEEKEGYTDSGAAWKSESSNSMVAFVSSVDVSDEGISFQVETRANGSAELTAYNEREQIAFVFSVEVKDGEMALNDSRTERYETEG